MKLAAIALDYDGTIAVDGRLDAGVREAIGVARQSGIVVVLVTGRRLNDLQQVAGDLSCFDVVVGENGAVLEFPATGRHVVIGHPPNASFLEELRRRHIPFVAGESVIEVDAQWAAPILDTIRSLEQPLILAFNRGRLMVLPQAIAKSTGLRQALLALRVSIHNTVGIGDAENDHDLLDACEVGVAVEWGSAALRAVADEVVTGNGPSAVAEYIRRVSRQPRLSAGQMGRRRLQLGHQHDGGRSASPSAAGRFWSRASRAPANRGWRAWCASSQSSRATACASSIRKATIGRSSRCRASSFSAGTIRRRTRAICCAPFATRTSAWSSTCRRCRTARNVSTSRHCCPC